jgi:hypothetical protein
MTKKILIVDDHSAMLQILTEKLLANSQYPVITVTDPFPPVPELEELDVFDSPGSCRGISPPRNRTERRANKSNRRLYGNKSEGT